MLKLRDKQQGFTIVELLIVIVVIGVLAAISIVAYNGVTAKARDAQRAQDMKIIAKALEMYYVDNGEFPASQCGSGGRPACPDPKKENSSWATTADGSWNVLEYALVPKYISALPKDPRASTATDLSINGGYNYEYLTWQNSCGLSSHQQTFALFYRPEVVTTKQEEIGTCPNASYSFTGYSGTTSYRVIKN